MKSFLRFLLRRYRNDKAINYKEIDFNPFLCYDLKKLLISKGYVYFIEGNSSMAFKTREECKKEEQESAMKVVASIILEAKTALNQLDKSEEKEIKEQIISNLDNLNDNLVNALQKNVMSTGTVKEIAGETRNYITNIVGLKKKGNLKQSQKQERTIRFYNDYKNFITQESSDVKGGKGLEFAVGLVVGTALVLATCVFFTMVGAGEIILPQLMQPLMLGIGLAMFAASIGSGFLAYGVTGAIRQAIQNTSQPSPENTALDEIIQKAKANMTSIAQCGRQLFFKDPSRARSSGSATAEPPHGYEPVSQM